MSRPPRVAVLERQGGVLCWHEDLEAGFIAEGASVISIQLRPASWDDHRAKWRTGRDALQNPAIMARVARELKAARPDLVVLLKQPGLPASTLDAWRSALPARVPFVGWICDHLPTWSSANQPGLDGVYYFDSATRPILDTAYSGRSVRLQSLPLAANPTRYPARAIPFETRRPRLVFAGKNTPARKREMAAFCAAGGQIDAYGPLADSGWRVWRRRKLDAANLAELYSRYFAVLNLLQAPNTLHGLNLRAFEAPAAGGLGTYPHVPDLPSAFVAGEEILAYRDMADLKTQIDHLLDRPERAAEIAAAGRARVLREHTFAHRARRMLEDWC